MTTFRFLTPFLCWISKLSLRERLSAPVQAVGRLLVVISPPCGRFLRSFVHASQGLGPFVHLSLIAAVRASIRPKSSRSPVLPLGPLKLALHVPQPHRKRHANRPSSALTSVPMRAFGVFDCTDRVRQCCIYMKMFLKNNLIRK